jgi:hypothetical protein
MALAFASKSLMHVNVLLGRAICQSIGLYLTPVPNLNRWENVKDKNSDNKNSLT